MNKGINICEKCYRSILSYWNYCAYCGEKISIKQKLVLDYNNIKKGNI